MSLKGNNICLTGGSGTLGQLIAAELTNDGACVTVLDRVAPQNASAPFIEADLGSLPGIALAADRLRNTPCDILINLAGSQYFGPFEQQGAANIDAGYCVNLIAPVHLSQAVLPAMKRRGAGQIVNVGSIFGSINFAYFVTYSSAKAGLRGFSEALRREVKDCGIAVTYVAPRAVKTAFNSEKVLAFAAATKMSMDPPAEVAGKICAAIRARRGDVYLGFPESLFVRINAIAPRVVDMALAAGDRQAGRLFAVAAAE
jgi:short-subunit dehydrogenase